MVPQPERFRADKFEMLTDFLERPEFGAWVYKVQSLPTHAEAPRFFKPGRTCAREQGRRHAQPDILFGGQETGLLRHRDTPYVVIAIERSCRSVVGPVTRSPLRSPPAPEPRGG